MIAPEKLSATIEDELRPLDVALQRAWWDAALSGSEDDYDRVADAHDAVDRFFADRDRFRALERAREAGVDDPLVARSIERMYLSALARQHDPALSTRMNALAAEIDRVFSTYRPEYEGARHALGDLEEVLRTERDEGRREAAWEATKAVGPLVDEGLRELVDLRNTAARQAGFSDFYTMQLTVGEQSPDGLLAFLDAIDRDTASAYATLKSDIDARLAERYSEDAADLMPWHYEDPFFQDAPAVFGADLDRVFADVDIIDVAARFFEGIGLPVNGVLDRSSLYESEGKVPHAFAIDIDRAGDVRILLNLRPNERWMGTTLHELGHAVYDLGISRDLPWSLRQPAHTLTTEAIAMLFGRLSRSPRWMASMGIVDATEAERLGAAVAAELRATMLIVARWVQVMSRFERALYADPDQDLNALWWSLVERYQGLTPPARPEGAADYAAKIHIVAAPAYYHNYLYGECFASQIHARLRADVLEGGDDYNSARDVGAWLTENIFSHGATYDFDELARRSTGRAVDAADFVDQFVA